MLRTLASVFVAVVLSGCSISVVENDDLRTHERASTASQGLSLRCAPDDIFESAVSICGDVSGAGSLSVEGNMSVAGDFSGAGSVSVEGDLAVAGDLSHAGSFDVGGEVRRGLAAPCGSKGMNVAAAVATARGDHDHEASTVLENGRYYFADASFVGENHIRVVGHASMFVDGDLDAVGSSSIFVEPGASLDLYVAGSVHAVGSMVAAGCDPNALRVFVGGSDSIIAGAGDTELRGFLYAPDAEVSLAGSATVTGAVVAKEISFAGSLHVRGIPQAKRPESACGRVAAEPEVTVN